LVSTFRYPIAAASRKMRQYRSSTALGVDEYGNLMSDVVTPAAPAMASWVWLYSHRRRQSGSDARSACEKLWTPSSCPAVWRSRTVPGCLTTWEPTTKKVAATPCRLSTSATRGVHFGSGPSSKVSAMVRGGSW
jgi:hypothetical protein